MQIYPQSELKQDLVYMVVINCYRCADIVYMNYADSHVPVSGKFDSGTFDFIQNDMVIKEI